MSSWLAVWLLGGLIGLDATSFPQVMISRPLVAGTLVGLVFGQPAAGALVGGVIEVFHLSILPIGATRYPEAGTATVAAAAAYIPVASHPLDGPALLLALIIALGWERVGGATANALRRYNERFAFADMAPDGAAARLVARRHRIAMAIDFARGATVSLAGALIGLGIVQLGVRQWAAHPMLAAGAITIAATAALGASLAVFGGWRERRTLFLAGVACGSLLLLAL
jgi:mannose/fructose/N-acetylgalactosamine-specific phosphotransferase system component IIC